MSRIAKQPILIPAGVNIEMDGKRIKVKGKGGELTHHIHTLVNVEKGETEENNPCLLIQFGSKVAKAFAGTTRALIANMVKGVSEGFERILKLEGVGYRAQVKGTNLSLSLGYSHPIEFKIPEAIQITTPDQTTIVIKGTDKQKVGHVAAIIRKYRPPEPYKGKGIRYSDEVILRKEANKK